MEFKPCVHIIKFEIIEAIEYTDGNIYERADGVDMNGFPDTIWFHEGYTGVHEMEVDNELAQELEEFYQKSRQGYTLTEHTLLPELYNKWKQDVILALINQHDDKSKLRLAVQCIKPYNEFKTLFYNNKTFQQTILTNYNEQ
jgi:glucan phosphorylase